MAAVTELKKYSSPQQIVSRLAVSVIDFYRNHLVGRKFVPVSSPNFATGMKILTGQCSTSQFTKEEIERAYLKGEGNVIATLGAALLFISTAQFRITHNYNNRGSGLLEIYHPPLPKGVKINYGENNTHIEIEEGIGFNTALGILAHGLQAFVNHWARCYLKYGDFGRDDRVGQNERILEIRKDGTAIVEVMDEPPERGSWGGDETPAKTHKEVRVEFKGHYHYRPEDVGTGYYPDTPSW